MHGDRLTSITLGAFRGVPGELTIELPKGQSLLVYGENGSGKSSIADGIEWYFTGGLELLSKEGREHALRHLGAGKTTTRVTIGMTGLLGGTCEPRKPRKDAVDVAALETFILRGRTIAEFVDKSKGEKWTALQRLLGLAGIEDLRADLQKARAELKRVRDASARALLAEEVSLRGRGIEPIEDAVVARLGKLAAGCGRPTLATVDEYCALADPEPVASQSAVTEASRRRRETRSLMNDLSVTLPPLDLRLADDWNQLVEQARADGAPLDVLTSVDRWSRSVSVIYTCPVCDQGVADAAFRSRLVRDLAALQDQAEREESARASIAVLRDAVRDLANEAASIQRRGLALKFELPEPPPYPPGLFDVALRERRVVEVAALDRWATSVQQWREASRQLVTEGAPPPSIPPQRSTEDAVELGLVLSIVRRWRAATHDLKRRSRALARAELVLDKFQRAQRRYVDDVLARISEDVDRIYQRLHPTRKIGPVAVETWDEKGIELAVDFYGSRQRPPQGVLSESYMNSLAIALFLAMARAFNERLGFLVLDDVVNSFDVTNRGRLGDVLAEDLADWQVILLTHDRYFFEQMKARGKGWAVRQFLAWSFADGPVVKEHRQAGEVEAALDELATGDTGGAARRGRRALETILKEICEELEVSLPYRRGRENELREVGALLNGVRGHLKAQAKAFLAANEGLIRDIDTDARVVLNPEAHASDVAPTQDDVRAALERIVVFDGLWSCAACHTRVWKVEGVRCKCGSAVFPPRT